MARTAFCLLLVLLAHSASAQTTTPDGWVVLPANEYRDLRARTLPPDPAPPPVDAAISRIDYTLRVGATTATGEARLIVDVFKPGWVGVRVPVDGLIVRAARLDGRPTPVVSQPEPQIVIARPGRSTVSLDVVIPLSDAAPNVALMMPPSPAPISTFAITRAGTAEDLHADGAFIAERTRTATETRWIVYTRQGNSITFMFERAADTSRAALPLQTRARVMELVTLGEDVSQANVTVSVDVVQGQTRDLVLTVPGGLTINQVTGAMLADWSLDGDRLSIALLEPLTSSTTLNIEADLRAPGSAISVPLVRVPGAAVETGGVAIDVAGAGEIEPGRPEGIEAADPSDLRGMAGDRASPSMVAFRFTPGTGTVTRSLPLTVTRYTLREVLVANVEEARYDTLATEDGKLLVRSRFTVRNNQRSFLAVTLPAGSTLWSAALGNQPVRPGVSPSGALLLPLQKGRPDQGSATFVVELLYLQRTSAWTGSGTARIALPSVDLPVSRTALLLHHSPRFSLEPRPGTFHVDVVPPPPAAAPPPPAPAAPEPPAEKDALQGFIDEARKSSGRSAAGLVPLTIEFPALGPVLAFAAELTPEGSSPALDIDYRRSSKR